MVNEVVVLLPILSMNVLFTHISNKLTHMICDATMEIGDDALTHT